MNDRYLYRAKRISAIEIPEDKRWIEGYYAYMKPFHYIMPKGSFDSWYRIDEKTLCQCTGIKDKNGKLIWENDIMVGHIDDMYPEDATYIRVLWHVSGFCTNENYSGDIQPIDEFDQNNFEVCGNIFDNTELLEVKE